MTGSGVAALAVLLLAVTCGPLAAVAGARTVRHARFDLAKHTAAGLHLGRTTKRQALARFGPPREQVADHTHPGNTWLRWSCGRGCSFDIGTRAGRVVTVWAYGQSVRKRFRTAAGSYLGISTARAERLDRGRFVNSCTTSFGRTDGGVTLDIGATRRPGTVDSLLMYTRSGGVDC